MLCTVGALTSRLTHPPLYLQSDHVSQLVMIPGIITAASKPRHAPVDLTVMCRDCRLETKLTSLPGVGGFTLPRTCSLSAGANGGASKCSLDPWIIMPNKSAFTDTQTLKLQVCCCHAWCACYQHGPSRTVHGLKTFCIVRVLWWSFWIPHLVTAQVHAHMTSTLQNQTKTASE